MYLNILKAIRDQKLKEQNKNFNKQLKYLFI